jgi:hypothetical protein
MKNDFSEPVEFVGRDHLTHAEPIPSKAKPAAPRGSDPVAVGPAVSGYIDSAANKTAAHPKHAVAGPRRAFEKAQQEVVAAQAEMTSAKHALTDAEQAEAEALRVWLELQRKPNIDQLLRDYANRSNETRAQNVREGKPPGGVKVPTHNRSPVDTVAAQRQRPNPAAANMPLRSPVSRRVV